VGWGIKEKGLKRVEGGGVVKEKSDMKWDRKGEERVRKWRKGKKIMRKVKKKGE
jgi:hypothetical protein